MGDTARLMVAPQNSDSFLVADFEAKQQAHCLKGIVAPVDIVSQEQVVGVRHMASNLEQLKQVIDLTVDVTADVDRRPHCDYVGLLSEYLFGRSDTSLALSHSCLTSCSLRSLHWLRRSMYSSKLPNSSLPRRFIQI